MKKLLNFLLLFSFTAVFVLPAAAWDDTGHKLSAYIAWQQMTPATREKAFNILLKAPEDSHLNVYYNAFETRSESVKRLDLFMIAATWGDIVRNRAFKVRYEKYNHSNWHYADIFWKQTGNQAEILKDFPEESGKAIPKLFDFEKTLRDPLASDEEKAIALAWFLHVGGDIHNPLHNASRVTELEPKGDQGGNMFLFTPQDGPRNQSVNLHFFWDSVITRNMPRKKDACDAEYIPGLAKKITKKYPYSRLQGRLNPGDFQSWHREGFGYLATDVYAGNTTRNEMPPKAYQKSSFKLGQQQIALAGYRLGETLNQIFSDKTAKIEECQIIRKVLYPVSKRRLPNQKMRIALLNVCPENRGMVARPMTTIFVEGEPVMYEYDVIKVFETETEARKFATDRSLKDVQF